MKILITGIAGFAGRYLFQELLANSPKGTEISGLGNEDLKTSDFEGLSQYACLDISNFDEFRGYLIEQEPDEVYHLAAFSSVAESLKHPVETFEINQMGSLYLLETAVNDLQNRPKILLISSADIYLSHPDGKPMKEDTPFNPLNPYAASKAAVDYLGDIYRKNFGLNVIRVRAFNHIGPGQLPVFAMSDFARQIARIEKGRQEPVLSVGNLEARRDFTDVRDVVRAYRKLMENGSPDEPYNVCSGNELSIEFMLRILLKMTETEIEVIPDPGRMRKSDNPVLLGDNSKLKDCTGWAPKISIMKTLEDMLNYWRDKVSYE